jgi:hypothetical protein
MPPIPGALNNLDRSLVKKTALFGILVLLIVYTTWKGIIPAWTSLHSDFPNYYLSASILLEGKDISHLYDDEWFNRQLQVRGLAEQGKFSPFPPATAFVLLPLAKLPPLAAKRAWTMCNICFLLCIIYLLQKVTFWNWIECAILVLITGQALINNFRLGQLYLMVSCLVVLSHYLIQRGKSGIAGILLGIVAIIKYFPVVFIAGYILSGNWKVGVYSIVTMLALLALQIGVFGTDVFTTYVYKVLVPHLQGDLSMQSPYAIAFQSWESLLRNIFVAHSIENPQPWINWPNGKWIVQALIYSSTIVSTVYILWQARSVSKPFQQWIFLSLPALAALVLSPASASYHFLLLIFPFAMVLLLLKQYQATFWIIGWFVFLYIAIGWVNYNHVWKITEPDGWHIILFYPRLWLLWLLFISYSWFIYRKLMKVHTAAIPFAEENL